MGRGAVPEFQTCAWRRPPAADFIPTPDVLEIDQTTSYAILTLESLVRMKLTSFRDKDRMHLRDLLDIGLIDADWTERFPAELAARLQELVDNPEG